MSSSTENNNNNQNDLVLDKEKNNCTSVNVEVDYDESSDQQSESMEIDQQSSENGAVQSNESYHLERMVTHAVPYEQSKPVIAPPVTCSNDNFAVSKSHESNENSNRDNNNIGEQQPASRFRRARIRETIEQWSSCRIVAHDSRVKAVPAWVHDLHKQSLNFQDEMRAAYDRRLYCYFCMRVNSYDLECKNPTDSCSDCVINADTAEALVNAAQLHQAWLTNASKIVHQKFQNPHDPLLDYILQKPALLDSHSELFKRWENGLKKKPDLDAFKATGRGEKDERDEGQESEEGSGKENSRKNDKLSRLDYLAYNLLNELSLRDPENPDQRQVFDEPVRSSKQLDIDTTPFYYSPSTLNRPDTQLTSAVMNQQLDSLLYQGSTQFHSSPYAFSTNPYINSTSRIMQNKPDQIIMPNSQSVQQNLPQPLTQTQQQVILSSASTTQIHPATSQNQRQQQPNIPYRQHLQQRLPNRMPNNSYNQLKDGSEDALYGQIQKIPGKFYLHSHHTNQKILQNQQNLLQGYSMSINDLSDGRKMGQFHSNPIQYTMNEEYHMEGKKNGSALSVDVGNPSGYHRQDVYNMPGHTVIDQNMLSKGILPSSVPPASPALNQLTNKNISGPSQLTSNVDMRPDGLDPSSNTNEQPINSPSNTSPREIGQQMNLQSGENFGPLQSNVDHTSFSPNPTPLPNTTPNVIQVSPFLMKNPSAIPTSGINYQMINLVNGQLVSNNQNPSLANLTNASGMQSLQNPNQLPSNVQQEVKMSRNVIPGQHSLGNNQMAQQQQMMTQNQIVNSRVQPPMGQQLLPTQNAPDLGQTGTQTQPTSNQISSTGSDQHKSNRFSVTTANTHSNPSMESSIYNGEMKTLEHISNSQPGEQVESMMMMPKPAHSGSGSTYFNNQGNPISINPVKTTIASTAVSYQTTPSNTAKSSGKYVNSVTGGIRPQTYSRNIINPSSNQGVVRHSLQNQHKSQQQNFASTRGNPTSIAGSNEQLSSRNQLAMQSHQTILSQNSQYNHQMRNPNSMNHFIHHQQQSAQPGHIGQMSDFNSSVMQQQIGLGPQFYANSYSSMDLLNLEMRYNSAMESIMETKEFFKITREEITRLNMELNTAKIICADLTDKLTDANRKILEYQKIFESHGINNPEVPRKNQGYGQKNQSTMEPFIIQHSMSQNQSQQQMISKVNSNNGQMPLGGQNSNQLPKTNNQYPVQKISTSGLPPATAPKAQQDSGQQQPQSQPNMVPLTSTQPSTSSTNNAQQNLPQTLDSQQPPHQFAGNNQTPSFNPPSANR